MRVVFFGGGLLPLRTFTKISELNYVNKLSLVTIENTSKSDERNELKEFAQKNGNNIYQPNLSNQQQIEEFIPKLQYDVGLVCNYKYMIPNQIIKQLPLFVIHPSLLPDYRGAAPIQWSLVNNEKETGVSFIEISENKFDAGKILLQTTVPILPNDRYLELYDKLSQSSCDQIDHFLQNYQTLQRTPQGTSPKKAPKQLPKFDLDNLTYPTYDLYRAYYGTRYKSIKLKYKGREIFIEKCQWATEQEIHLLKETQSENKKQIYTIKRRPFTKYIYIRQNDQYLRIEEFRFTDSGQTQKGIRLLDSQDYFD